MFDPESVSMMLQMLAICLILTGIHGYLGIHVLERKVIFVDLAMAQIAALGATVALVLGYETGADDTVAYLFSLGFTLTGAAVFSLTRMRAERIPQEALIGIVYATASAVAILLLAKSTTAGEHLKGMLVGNILLVTWPDVVKTAAIYLAIGAFHWAFRDRFFRVTMASDEAFRSGMRVRLWDFLFYATFGVVITSSVAIAGVLLVFSFLVVPAAIGVMLADGVRSRILVAWGTGTAVSVAGTLYTFYEGNLPAGPVVVASFALALLLVGLCHYVKKASRRGPALARVAVGVAAVASLVALLPALRKTEAHDDRHTHAERDDPDAFLNHLLEDLACDDEMRQVHAIDSLARIRNPRATKGMVALLRRTPCDRVVEKLAVAFRETADPAALPALKEVLGRDPDPALRLDLAEAVLTLRDPAGLGTLIGIFADETAPRLAAEKAFRRFETLTGKGFGYRVGGDRALLERIRDWWEQHRGELRWNDSAGRFEPRA
jgi:zinc/manganese transport system permease protein